MSKKKITIIAIIAVVLNLAALLFIFIYLDRKQAQEIAAAQTTQEVADSAKTTQAPAKGGVVSKLIQDIKKREKDAKAKLEARKKLLLRNDTLKARSMPAHQAHALQHELKKSPLLKGAEKEWDKVQDIVHSASTKLRGKYDLDPQMHVFGWHPYWMGTAYKSYNYSLLSTIAYFSYELDPATGEYISIHDWMTTSLVDSATSHYCNILLTVSCFGQSNLSQFLNDTLAQHTFAATILPLLTQRNASGINIDFEGIASDDRDAFTAFVARTRELFIAEDPSLMITMAIPAVDWHRAYDLAALEPYVDHFVIMGYDYYSTASETAGPVSPLRSGEKWWQYNIERSVNAYLEQVTASKLLLGLPYYGTEWVTESAATPSRKKHFSGHRPYRELKHKLRKLESILLDSTSVTAYYTGYDASSKQYRQTWFDNAATLEYKIQWAKDKKLGGIGIWALGYDNGHTELWEMLRDNLRKGAAKNSSSIVIKNIPKSHVTPADTVDTLAIASAKDFRDLISKEQRSEEYGLVLADGRYFVLKDPLIPVLAVLIAFFFILLLQILLDSTPWKDRYLARLIIYAVISLLILIVLALLALGWLLKDVNGYVMMFAGLLAGFLLARLASRFIQKREERLP